jgi:hypothetical protein
VRNEPPPANHPRLRNQTGRRGLFTAIDDLDAANARAVARAGRYIAEDWANTLDVDAEHLRIEAARLDGEVRS